MDLPALRKVVEEYVRTVNDVQSHLDADDRDEAENHRQNALRQLPGVQAIARRLPNAPDPDDLVPQGWVFGGALNAALRLLGTVEVEINLAAALEDPVPVATSAQLHHWVWNPAQSLWQTGHHRNAVHAAATLIEEHLQAKLGRDDVTGAALAREAFTLTDPQPGKPRLRFKGLTGDTHRSAHEGAMHFAEGCFMLIRNSAAHRTTKLNETAALEQLTALSYLSRLIESATVRRAPIG